MRRLFVLCIFAGDVLFIYKLGWVAWLAATALGFAGTIAYAWRLAEEGRLR